jgi:tetratricopeptide (TPR) repeat protein
MMIRIVALALVWVLSIAGQARAERISDAMYTEELKKAWVLVEMGHFDEALKLAGQCADNDKAAAPCRFVQAKAFAGKNKYGEAAAAYRSVYYGTKNMKMKEDALYNRSRMYRLAKYDLEARAGYQSFLKEFPKSEFAPQAQLELAGINLKTGKTQEALKGYDAAGYIPEALYGKANAMQMTGMTKEAVDAYKIARDADREYLLKSQESLYYYGESLMQRGKYKGAVTILTLVKDQPYKDMANITLGMVKMKEKNPSRAVDFFKEAAKSEDNRIKGIAWLNIAQAEIVSKKLPEAEKSINMALKSFSALPRDADAAKLILSDIYRGQGKYEDSVKTLREIIAARRFSDDAIERMGAIFQEMLEKDPKSFVKLWDASSSYLVDRRKEDFLIKTAGALKGSGKPYMDLVTWLVKYGSDPVKIKYINELVKLYAGLGDIKNAWKYLALLKKAVGENDDIHRLEADLYYLDNQPRQALGKIFLIKKLKKEDLAMIRVTVSASEYQEQTVTFYDKAVQELGGDVEDYLKLADLYIGAGKKAEGLQYYRKAVNADPKNEWALFQLAALGEASESEKSLQALSKLGLPFGAYATGVLKESAINRKLSEVY